MKIGLAVATADALPSAFVVFRDDLCTLVDRCCDLGYDGVELALRFAKQVNLPEMKRRLSATGMEIPCISSGQVFAADHLYFTHPRLGRTRCRRRTDYRDDPARRRIGCESEYRPRPGHHSRRRHGRSSYRRRYLSCLEHCADVAEPLGVELIIEPVNRYEVNFINNCSEGLEIVQPLRTQFGQAYARLVPYEYRGPFLPPVLRSSAGY